ncbi:M1 family aminopeptidase [Crocinitomicaceae bacterium]|nr:M1 family aminopeptidase [Crocinitomicaceae bacterium]
MKYLFPTLTFLLISSFVYSQSTLCGKHKKFNTSLKSNSLSLNQIAETELYDVHFYHLDLNMTNLSTALSGTVRMDASANESLDSALYELFSGYTITEIRVNGNAVDYSRNNSAIKVPVDAGQNEIFTIETDYSGTPPTAATNPLGGAGMSQDDSPTWGNEVVWSLSEPFSAYEWFPCKQSLTDKADSSFFFITVPSNLKAGSNGLLEQVVDLGNGFSRYEWKHRHPIDYYLISVSVSSYVEYNVYANPVGAPNPILIQNYIYDNPQTLINFQDDIDETVDFMELFYDLYGPYPFEDEKYGHCMAPFSGGMEHQTMTTQGFFTKGLTTHELGHQWWGDNVTCASWCDIWINEGFASYSEYLMLENLYPSESAGHMEDVHNNVMNQNGGSVWVLDSLNENRIFSGRLTYDKGAAILHTMRYMVNDDALFFDILRDFQVTFKDSTAYGIDFKEALEEATGIDFNPVFEEWYFGEGYPTYSLLWQQTGEDVILQINHTTSKPNVTATFTNDLDIRFIRPGIGDTIVRFDISGNSNTFTINNIGTIASSISVDPENWIINRIGSIVQSNELGLNEPIMENEISLHPNPSNGTFQIKNLKNKAEVKVYNLNGKVKKTLQVNPNELININDLNKGTYIIEIQLINNIKRLKIISI